MHFKTPRGEVAFEIPDEWWRFSEMDTFTSQGGRFYPYCALRGDQEIDAVSLVDVEPPMRNSGVPPFKKYKMVPILFAFCSPECALPARPRSSSTDKISQQSQGRERNRAMRCARGEDSTGPCYTSGMRHSYSPYRCFIERLLELRLVKIFLR